MGSLDFPPLWEAEGMEPRAGCRGNHPDLFPWSHPQEFPSCMIRNTKDLFACPGAPPDSRILQIREEQVGEKQREWSPTRSEGCRTEPDLWFKIPNQEVPFPQIPEPAKGQDRPDGREIQGPDLWTGIPGRVGRMIQSRGDIQESAPWMALHHGFQQGPGIFPSPGIRNKLRAIEADRDFHGRSKVTGARVSQVSRRSGCFCAQRPGSPGKTPPGPRQHPKGDIGKARGAAEGFSGSGISIPPIEGLR